MSLADLDGSGVFASKPSSAVREGYESFKIETLFLKVVSQRSISRSPVYPLELFALSLRCKTVAVDRDRYSRFGFLADLPHSLFLVGLVPKVKLFPLNTMTGIRLDRPMTQSPSSKALADDRVADDQVADRLLPRLQATGRWLVALLCLTIPCCGVALGQDASAKTGAKPQLSAGMPNYPLDAVFADDGTGYIVDRYLPGVWKWQDGKLSVFFQGEKKFRTPLNAPRCLAIDSDGVLLVGDSSTREVYRVSGLDKAEPITGGKIGIPSDLSIAPNGDIYVADLELRRVVRIPKGEKDPVPVASVNPRGLFVDTESRIWVVSQNAEQLQMLTPEGESTAVVSKRTFEFPHQVVVDKDGNAYVSDGYRKAIWKITKGGKPEILVEGEPLDNPVGISLAGDELRVTDPRARKVFRLTTDGKLETLIDVKP